MLPVYCCLPVPVPVHVSDYPLTLKAQRVTCLQVNGEVKVDADHKVSSSSAGKASFEALDSMGESLRAAC